jgi:succinate-semialdehyde dehydrogenase/glutarate-semialdehyde dehydrogenase
LAAEVVTEASRTQLESVNPCTNEVVEEYPIHSADQVAQIVDSADAAQQIWAGIPIEAKSAPMLRLAEILEQRIDAHAQLITREVGKPLAQSRSEISKSIDTIRHYAANSERYLAPEVVSDGTPGRVVWFEPVGLVLAIMPWNFPYWQVFRLIAPALMAGNGLILKHASNVPACAQAIGDAVESAGFPEGLMRTVFLPGAMVEPLISHPSVGVVCVTGSSEVGAHIAGISGRALKPQVLELGGSDPYIVLADADVERAAREGARARVLNAGQSCVAAKRFLVHSDVYDDFTDLFLEEFRKLNVGDPMDPNTDVGPLARPDLIGSLQRQVTESIEMGAVLEVGGHPIEGPGNFYEPTVLTEVTPEMPVFSEETFGPVAAVTKAGDDDEIIRLANATEYGLGASIWTRDADRGQAMARRVVAGAVFINARVSSDPQVPFGGTRHSGYGRELGSHGIRELTNIKAVVAND